MTPINIAGINLQNGERAFYQGHVQLMESRSVTTGYEGGSQGISVRVCKGVWLRDSSHRGRMIRERRMVAVSQGVLILTNMRVLYYADSKSFDVPYSRLVLCELYRDAVIFGIDTKTRVLKCKTTDALKECLRRFLPFQQACFNRNALGGNQTSGVVGIIIFVAVIWLFVKFAGPCNSENVHTAQDVQHDQVPVNRLDTREPVSQNANSAVDDKVVSPKNDPVSVGNIATFSLKTGRVMYGRITALTANSITIRSVSRDVSATITRDQMTTESASTIFGQ